MKRATSIVSLIATVAFMLVASPNITFAQKSCIDQYHVCINNASAYTGGAQTAAEFECGVEYTGCLANKLKFW